MHRYALTVLVLVAVASLPGCRFFTEVTVPSIDNGEPTAWVSVYYDGAHQGFGTSSMWMDHVIKDPEVVFFVIGAGTDPHGIARVEMEVTNIRHNCESEVGHFGQENTGPIPDIAPDQIVTQAGAPGDVVSDGLFAAHPFSIYTLRDDTDACGDFREKHPGLEVRVTGSMVEFKTTTWDFHGNTDWTSDTVTYHGPYDPAPW